MKTIYYKKLILPMLLVGFVFVASIQSLQFRSYFFQTVHAETAVPIVQFVKDLALSDAPKTMYSAWNQVDSKTNTQVLAGVCKILYSKNETTYQNIPDALGAFYTTPYNKVLAWKSPFATYCGSNTNLVESNNGTSFALRATNPTKSDFKTLTIFSDHILLSINSYEHFTKTFGALFYRDGSKTDWPDYFLEKNITPPKSLTSMINATYTFDAKLVRWDETKTTLSTPGAIPAGSQKTYDQNKHTAQLVSTAHLQWTDASCTEMIPTDPLCKYQKKGFWYQVQMADSRFEFLEDWSNFNDKYIMFDAGTQTFGYRQSLKQMLPQGTVKNPYKIVGNRYTVEYDLLPSIKSAILQAEAESKKTGIMYIPPRRIINGVTENDAQYFAHFAINSFHTGYEVPGLANLSYEFYDVSLVDTRVALKSCTAGAKTVPSGNTLSTYVNSTVLYGGSCAAKQSLCQNGGWVDPTTKVAQGTRYDSCTTTQPSSGFFCDGGNKNIIYQCAIDPSKASTMTSNGWSNVGNNCYHGVSGVQCSTSKNETTYPKKGTFCSGDRKITEWVCGGTSSLPSPWTKQDGGCYHMKTTHSCLPF